MLNRGQGVTHKCTFPQSLRPYLERLRMWFSLLILHSRVLSLHGYKAVFIEVKVVTCVLKVIPWHPFDNVWSTKNGIDFAIILETWRTLCDNNNSEK